MNAEPALRTHRNVKLIPRFASGLVVLAGAQAVVGWSLGFATLRQVLSGLPPMMPNTAVALVLAGVSLWFAQDEAPGVFRRGIAQACALAVGLFGLVTLGEYLFDWETGIDQLLFKDALGQGPLPGRAAILTSFNFFLLGMALLSLDVKARFGQMLVEGLTVTAMLISLLALIGYACNIPSFYGWRSLYPNTGMALHTVIAFVVLAAGVLFARPGRGLAEVLTGKTHGGIVARRLLLAPVVIPLATGLIHIAGQGLGLYNAEFAAWLFAFLNIFVFTVAIWWIATLLHRAEVVRRHAEDDLRDLNVKLEQRVGERTAELSQTMRSLEESEERVRLILDSALDAVITIDEQGRITSWTRESERIFGWIGPEMIGQSLSNTIIPPRYREAHERGLKHFLATKEGPVLGKRIEITAMRRDGKEFPIELAITPIRLGGRFIFSAFVRDITERNRTEKALRESERLLRLVIDLVPHFIFAKDAKGRHLFANRACAQASGLTPQQMVGRSDLDLLANRAQAEAFMRDDQEVIAGGPRRALDRPYRADALSADYQDSLRRARHRRACHFGCCGGHYRAQTGRTSTGRAACLNEGVGRIGHARRSRQGNLANHLSDTCLGRWRTLDAGSDPSTTALRGNLASAVHRIRGVCRAQPSDDYRYWRMSAGASLESRTSGLNTGPRGGSRSLEEGGVDPNRPEQRDRLSHQTTG